MLRFIGLLVVIGFSFAGGYYFGQRPVGTLLNTVSDLQQSIKDLSRSLLDATTGIERDLRRRQGLVDAKSRLVQAKAHIIDRRLREAAKELAEAGDALEEVGKGTNTEEGAKPVRELSHSLQDLRLTVARGQSVPLKKLDALQRRLDQLLSQ